MLDELRARFLPQFLDTARQRMQRVFGLLSPEHPANAREVVAEVHTLGGEAGLLGYPEVASLAKDVEQAALRWQGSSDAGDVVTCARSARLLVRALKALEPPDRVTPPPVSARSRSLRILVVDDSALGSVLLRDILERAGHVATAAHDLETAVVEAQRLRPEIVLCDVEMPGCTIGDVVARMRALPEAEGARVFLLSGLDDAELEARALAVGADGFLSKRDGLDAVVARVARLASGKKGGPDADVA